MKIRGAFLMSSLKSWGGSESMMALWASHLNTLGHEIQIVAADLPLPGHGLPTLQKNLLVLREDLSVKSRPWIAFLRVQRALAWYRNQMPKPHLLVMTKSVQLVPFSILKLLGFIGTTHLSYHAHMSALQYVGKYSPFKKWLLRQALDSLIVLINDLPPTDFRRSDLPSSVLEMPNPTPLQSDITSDLQSSRVIYVGRLSPEKGVDFLIRSWALVKADPDASNWTLRIVGDGPDRQALENLARKLGVEASIEWTGFTNDVRQHYLAASILVMPSEYEGMPLVLLEAKQMGLPVVSTNHLGAQRYLTPGQEGLIANYQDTNGFAAAITKLIKEPDLMQKFGRFTRSRADEFTVEKMDGPWRALFASFDHISFPNQPADGLSVKSEDPTQ